MKRTYERAPIKLGVLYGEEPARNSTGNLLKWIGFYNVFKLQYYVWKDGVDQTYLKRIPYFLFYLGEFFMDTLRLGITVNYGGLLRTKTPFACSNMSRGPGSYLYFRRTPEGGPILNYLLVPVADFTTQLSQLYEHHSSELQVLVASFRKRSSELRKER